MLDLVKQLDLALDGRVELFRMLLRPLVVVEAFEVEHVLSELILVALSLVLLFQNGSVALLLQIFVLVAVIVATRFLSVFRPGAQAHPAKIVVANSASHVVAALVLLNGLLAFWTVLSVSHNPGDVLRLR